MRQLVTKPPLRINVNFNKPQTTRNPWHLSLAIAGAFYSFYFNADIFYLETFSRYPAQPPCTGNRKELNSNISLGDKNKAESSN